MVSHYFLIYSFTLREGLYELTLDRKTLQVIDHVHVGGKTSFAGFVRPVVSPEGAVVFHTLPKSKP